MATIYDVARRAEVSIGTVSRVLNGNALVRPVTRKAVEVAIAELDYRPNALARSLLRASTQTLGMVLPDLSSPMMTRLIRGAESAALAGGFTLLLTDSHGDEALQTRHINSLRERRVDGMVVFPLEPAVPLPGLGGVDAPPVILIGATAWRHDQPAVLMDERTAFQAAFADLAGRGHRRIALIVSPRSFTAGPARARAFRALVARSGLSAEGCPVLKVEAGEECRLQVQALLAQPEPPTALIAGSHGLAPGCLQAIAEAELWIPRDLSFIACGDSDWAAAYNPPLNVVAMDIVTVAEEATRSLICRIGGEASPAVVKGEAAYLRRASVAPPPAAVADG